MSSKKDEDLKDVEMAPLKGGDSSNGNNSSSTATKVLHHPPSVNTKAAYACAMYSFCSVSMVLVNKSLASRYAWGLLLSFLRVIERFGHIGMILTLVISNVSFLTVVVIIQLQSIHQRWFECTTGCFSSSCSSSQCRFMQTNEIGGISSFEFPNGTVVGSCQYLVLPHVVHWYGRLAT